MLTEFYAPKRNMLIFYGLDPFLIFVFNENQSWYGFGDVHVNTDSSIGGISTLEGCLSHLDVIS